VAATSYYASANRYVKQGKTAGLYEMTATAPAIAEALDALKAAPWLDAPWSLVGSFPGHTGLLTDADKTWDAYAVCTNIDATTGAQNSRLGCVAYRIDLPAAAYAGGALLVSVGVSVSGDPYLSAGARVAVKLSSTATPATDWATIIAGDAYAAAVAPRTTAVVNGLTRWYPATSDQTITLNANGVQALRYIWIYLSLENYASCSRMPWIEGGASLSPVITLTYSSAVAGLTAGTNIGGTVAMPDLACNRVTLLDKSFGYYQSKGGTPGNTTNVERLNSLISNFTETTIIEATGTNAAYAGISAGVAWSDVTAVMACAAVFPVSAHIPAGMPIRSLILSRPPDWTGCSFVLSAYWVPGPITAANAKTVPNTDHDFWMGKSLAPTIAGKTAALLGRVVMTSRPAGTVSIPVVWTASDKDQFGSVYIIMMPVDVVTASSSPIKVGGLSMAVGTPWPAVIGFVADAWLPTSVSLSASAA
jgi:hypothetical protein